MQTEYHSVKLNDSSGSLWEQMVEWCNLNCTDKFFVAPAWAPIWGFKNPADATAFALRWQGSKE